MKHLKLFENFNDKELLEDIADIFLEYKDEYDLTRVDDVYEQGMRIDVANVYEIRYIDEGKFHPSREGPRIILDILFDDYFGAAGDDEGFLKLGFENDMKQFIKRCESIGCYGKVFWEGGAIYQIVFELK